ncbi:MAG: outer membrane beta-barrel protein [Oceanococcus sp.]
MKGKFQALVLLLGCVGVSQAQADWFNVTEGSTGFYAAGGLNVTKVTGLLDRRLGGDGDQGDTDSNSTPQFRVAEPGINTLLELRGGWQPFAFLAVEARYGVPLDSDSIENQDNTQTLKLDSLYGIYLKPQLNINDSLTLVASIGYAEFDYSIRRLPGHSDESTVYDLNNNGAADARGDSDNREFTGFGDSGLSWGAGIQMRLSGSTRISFEYNQYYDETQTMSDVSTPNAARNRPESQDITMFNIGFNVTYLFGQDGGSDDYY